MKVLVVSQFYTPDITAAAFRISETVAHLRNFGNEVEVVTTFPHKSENINEASISKKGVHRVHLPDTESKGFLGYIYLYLSFMAKSIIKGYSVGKQQKPDVVWASSPPIFVGLAGWVLAKLLRAEFALDVRDIWPASAVAAGQISDSGFAYRAGRWMEKFLYKQADLITCVAGPMKRYIRGYTSTNVEIIYNAVEVSAGASEKDKSLNNRLEELTASGEVKKILYAGNLGHVQQLDLLVEAFDELKAKSLSHEWEVFFLGGGAQKENLVDLVESRELKDVFHFLDPVPKEEVFEYLKSADVLFIHLMDSEVLRLTIPSKVFDYMLADRPLLTGIHGEGKKIIQSVDGNVLFQSGSKESLIHAIKKLDEAITIQDHPENAKRVMNKYSRRNQASKLDQSLKRMTG